MIPAKRGHPIALVQAQRLQRGSQRARAPVVLAESVPLERFVGQARNDFIAREQLARTLEERLAAGRALYVDKCSGCHNLHLPAEYTPEEWKGYVAYMTAEAKITPQEAQAISHYLAATSARNRGMASSNTAGAGGR